MTDYRRPITADELIRQYDLNSLKKTKTTVYNQIKELNSGLQSTNTNLQNFVDATTSNIEDLQDQIDGNITTWFYNGVPTLNNAPAEDWTTDTDKDNHLGDLYYDQNTGYSYRFAKTNNTYSWIKLTDSDITEALALANAAQDTADSKRRVFVTQPIPPYDVGDMWTNGTDLYRCKVTRASGSFNNADWVLATNYTDDSYARGVEAALNSYKTEVSTTYSTKSELTTATDEINGNVSALTTRTTTLEGQMVTKATTEQVSNLSIRADGIESRVSSVSTVANTANSTANTANSNASTALSTANTANSTANTANSTANTASSNATSALNKINNLKVGGRNLLLGTGTSSTSTGTNGTNQTKAIYSFSDFYYQNYYPLTAETGESIEVTISLDWETTATSGTFFVQLNSWPYTELIPSQTVSSSNQSGHIEKTVTITKNASNPTNYSKIMTRLDNLTGNVTLSNVKLEIGNKATDWTPAPEDVDSNIDTVQNNLDNLQVGGRNLWINSKNISKYSGTINGAASYTWDLDDQSVPSSKYFSFVAPSGSSVNSGPYFTAVDNVGSLSRMNANETYTLSFYIKATVATNLVTANLYEGQTFVRINTNNVGTSWTKIVCTFEWTNTSKNVVCFYVAEKSSANTICISSIKLEKGEKATDWSPAPEDVDADIQDVSDTVDETNNNVADLGERTGALETGMAGKVDNDEFKDYKEYVTEHYTTITQTDDKISIGINEATKTLVTKAEYSSTTSSLAEVRSYFDFASEGLTIGKSTSNTTLLLSNDKLMFKLNGAEKAYMSPNSFVLKELNTFKLGGFAFKVRANGNLALVWVGEEE